jgi:hypothetical protein
MRKIFAIPLISLLFLSMFCISGCYVAGSVYGITPPPRNIICENPCTITVTIFGNPPEMLGKHIERCKNVTLHIRYSSNNDFTSIPMALEKVNSDAGELCWNANIDPFTCDIGIEYVEYYIDYTFGYNYQKYYRTNCYRIPVIMK